MIRHRSPHQGAGSSPVHSRRDPSVDSLNPAESMQFSNTITIERSPRDVFEFISDLENVPKWNYAIVETRKASEGPVAVGTTYRQVRSLPNRSEETLQVTEFQPDRRFAFEGGLGPFEGTLTYEVEEIGGRTRLTNDADLQPRGIAKLAAPIAANRVRGAVAENLGALKQLLERGSARK
jgi:carbon monoxide dehydrogenase subunit G